MGASCDGAVLAAARIDDDGGSARYRVVAWLDGAARCVEVVGEDEAWARSLRFVQRLPDGFLLVGARCWWRRTGIEENAAAYDWSGRLQRRFTLGDGIEDVRTTPSGRAWVSYFDEGIFGNRGWNHPGPPCIGEPGCLGFDSTGEIRARFDGDAAGAGPIADVYALNVAGDGEVWLYPYLDFPIVRWSGGGERPRYRTWSCPIAGAHALAVSGDRALLVGSYDDRSAARVLRLERGGRAVPEAESGLTLVDDAGRTLREARVFGVGHALYVFRGAEVLLVESW